MDAKHNYKQIYELLGQLCKSEVGDNYKKVQRDVNQFLTNSETGLFSPLSFEESIIVQKIKNHLIQKSENGLPLFMSCYEDLVAVTESKFRTSVLTFLLNLSDVQNKLPQAIRYNFDREMDNMSNGTKRSSQSGSNIDQIFKNLQEKSPSLSSNPSENMLKLVTFQKKTATDLSTQSDIGSETDGSIQLSMSEDLIQEIIYSLTGKAGKYLKKDITGEFKLDIKARNLSIQESASLLRMADTGFVHSEIYKYTNSNCQFFLCGLFGQGLISQIKTELTEYYGLIAMLQEKLNSQRNKTNIEYDRSENWSLIKVQAWLAEPANRIRYINQILTACRNLKGGPMVSVLYNQLFSGDPSYKQIVKAMLIAACRPLQSMLSHWLLEGEIKDPHNEFFIEEFKEVSSDQLWHRKYGIVKSRLPTFIPYTMAKKILTAGKSINFLREVCQDKSSIKGRDELKQYFENNVEDLFDPTHDTKLHEMIDNVYLNTSKKVMDIALGTYRLLEHLQAMRKYLLMGQGDFIGLLMENLKDELDRPATDLYQHALFSIMASSIRATSQYDDPDILEHLDVKLLYPFHSDKGWDIFSLQYTVKGPLATILEPNMVRYQELFKPLWKAKHVEFVLSNIWKEQMINYKALRVMRKDLNFVTYRLHLYTSEMIHFIHQMQYYVLFEVIECSWATFIKKVQQAKALDDILEAHEQFLEAIKTGVFIDQDSDESLYLNLETIYNSIMKLEEWQKVFYEHCFKEQKSRNAFEENIRLSEKRGDYGVTAEQRLQRDEEIKIFEQILINSQRNLDGIGNQYETLVRNFLLKLTSSKDHNLQLFGIRLDFNEYYKRRDQRLNHPLTYEHMRSSGMGNSMFSSMRMSMSRQHN